MGYSMKGGNDPEQNNNNSHSYADQLDQLQYQNEASRQFSQGFGQQSYEQSEREFNQQFNQQYGQQQYNNQYNGGQNFYGNGQNAYGADPYSSGFTRTSTRGFGGQLNDIAHSTPVPVSSDRINSILANSFLYMFFALMLTAVASMFFYETGALYNMIQSSGSSVIWISFIIEIAIVFGSMAAIKSNNVGLTAGLYILYCIVNAFTLSIIFYAYTAGSIYKAFFMCAFIFGVMAVFGMVTKTDLTSVGRLCMIGLFGVIIASLVNIFVGGDTMDMVISWVAIAVFLGLTAYDTQKIKKLAASNTGLSPAIISMYGAFELYLDFINLFLRLLRLFGKRN